MRPLILIAAVAAAALVAPRLSASETIDNDIPEGTLGHWSVWVDDGAYSDDGEITAQRQQSGDIVTENVIYDYIQYIDVGNDGDAVSLQDSADGNNTVSVDEEGDDMTTSTGELVGANDNDIHWTATSWIDDGSPTMFTRIVFESEGPLGVLRLISYLDEDVEGSSDDVLLVRGSAANNNLELLTLDGPEVYGVSQSGATTGAGGLVDSTFAGWAAGPYDDVQENVEGEGQDVSHDGVVFGLGTQEHPTLGTVHGPEDITTVMSYDVNPTSTRAEILIALGGIAEPPSSCVQGDIDPPSGDDRVTLRDAYVAWRMLRGGWERDGREIACGDLWPGYLTCGFGGAFSRIAWCPDGDGYFTLGDAKIITLMVLGILTIDCDDCHAEDRAAQPVLPGDLAPAGAPDGVVDVADAVRALRLSVGLDVSGDEDLRRGDVMPAHPGAASLVVDGNDVVDIADVVGLLRAAVGLQTMQWPERLVTVPLDGADLASVGTAVTLVGWPAWAEPVGGFSDACPDRTELLVGADAWGFACMNDGGLSAPEPAVTFVYRGPDAVDPASLGVRAEVLSPAMVSTPLAPTPR